MTDLGHKFFNRELSWLNFNIRVMEEAANPRNPLLERLRFLSISATNLDEFYMVRVAGLRTQALTGTAARSLDGMTATEQLKKIRKNAKTLIKDQQALWASLCDEMMSQKIMVKTAEVLSEKEVQKLKAIYDTEILPLLTPLAIDPAHPFPFIPNLGFGVVLSLRHNTTKAERKSLITIPAFAPRFIALHKHGASKKTYVSLEDTLKLFAPHLFPESTTEAFGVFRITRDSEMTIDEEAEDLVLHFKFLLKKRRRGRVIRLELNASMPANLKNFLIENFEAWDEEIFSVGEMLGLGDLDQLISRDNRDLVYPPYEARFPERIREHDGDCFSAIAAKDILVHHPYEEFDVVVQFLNQAARDPKVVAIRQTLYRTSDDSPIVRALIEAAENGKNVTALVELKARFDEEVNLRWARDLELAGAQVVYGFIDYKTHAKLSLVVRQEVSGLKTYTHIGTGNYHAQNAKIYTDLALFTVRPEFGRDAMQVFNYVTSYSKPTDLNQVIVAPLNMRDKILEHIDLEIGHAKSGAGGAIWAKMNALVDNKIIEKLYEASQVGVQIDLVVRGICCLKPGVEGLSDNIRVKSIVGRFLEHSRIVCFGNGATLPNPKAHIYFGSADWMPRNLNRRIETLVPAVDPTVRRQIQDQIMVANIKDNTNSWFLNADGSYTRTEPGPNEAVFSAHGYFMHNPSLSGRGRALSMDRPSELVPKTINGVV